MRGKRRESFQAEGNRKEQLTREIVEYERPPMITIPAYREKHGIDQGKE